jgi:hypothetical protein
MAGVIFACRNRTEGTAKQVKVFRIVVLFFYAYVYTAAINIRIVIGYGRYVISTKVNIINYQFGMGLTVEAGKRNIGMLLAKQVIAFSMRFKLYNVADIEIISPYFFISDNVPALLLF